MRVLSLIVEKVEVFGRAHDNCIVLDAPDVLGSGIDSVLMSEGVLDVSDEVLANINSTEIERALEGGQPVSLGD